MYLIIYDSSEDYCDLTTVEELTDNLINQCLNVGDIQIVNMSSGTFLVDCKEALIWQKIKKEK